MIEIDGSHGEGGGQVLRTALALSSVLGEPVKVYNIRAGRPKPGLAPQHVTAIEAVARVCDAEVDGVFPGSKEVCFRPGSLVGGEFEFDVGTAGSISLVLQGCLLPCALSKSAVRITIRGGTDVKWSPPVDFMRLVHLPLLSRFGPACELELVSRGFYPEGGGQVFVEVSPVPHLRGVDLGSRGEVLAIEGIAYAQNLPEHVLTRMKHSVMKRLVGFGDISIEQDLRRGTSTGAGLVLVARCANTLLGESALGEKGVRAETLGETCAAALAETVGSGATVDSHMLDQILPYMALADGGSRVLAEELTGHAETNMWVIERFLGRRFSVRRAEGLVEVSVP